LKQSQIPVANNFALPRSCSVIRFDPLHFYCRPLTNENLGAKERWNFNKEAFLQLVVFFLKGGLHAETSWKIFCQMADASRQETTQGKELLLATILEAVFRTIYNRPFKPQEQYEWSDKVHDMEQFKKS
jgi:hypothetical protein